MRLPARHCAANATRHVQLHQLTFEICGTWYRYLLPEKELFNRYKYDDKEITEKDIQRSLLEHEPAGPLSINSA